MKKGFRWLGFALLVASVLLIAVSCAGTGNKNQFKVPEEFASIEQYSTPYQIQVDGKLHFYFLASEGMKIDNPDSGGTKWGDSCLIVLPDGQIILIDTGFKEYSPLLTLNLMKMGVTKIDYFINSHPHGDHSAAFYQGDYFILKNFEVGHFIYGGTYNSVWSVPHLWDYLGEQYNIPVDAYKAGDTFTIGDLTFEVYNPLESMFGQTFNTTPDVNNSSLVFKLKYGDFTALFTGDLYAAQESKLVEIYGDELQADLLKIPHHGHNTSSTRVFANAVKPKIAVATGYVPIEQQLYVNYTKNGAKVLFDYADGYIHVWTDGNGFEYETSRERTLTLYDKLEAGSPALEKLK